MARILTNYILLRIRTITNQEKIYYLLLIDIQECICYRRKTKAVFDLWRIMAAPTTSKFITLLHVTDHYNLRYYYSKLLVLHQKYLKTNKNFDPYK